MKGKLSGSWKSKHKVLWKKKNIIKKMYQDGMSVKDIASECGVSEFFIYKYIRIWGLGRRRGIKFILGKLLSEKWPSSCPKRIA